MNTGHIFLYWQIGLLFTTRKSCLVLNDSAKKFVIQSTTRRIDAFEAMLEEYHLDRHTVINELVKWWVLDNLEDDELTEPVRVIFGSMADS
jgi:hypothetical protein